jgi:HD superfamily phosphohydrolase YqeK
MRQVAYENLDKAILMEANRKIEYLIKLGAVIHPSTVEMRNWLLEKTKKKENYE